ncbi:MAG: hypothetical protein HC805_08245 [Alkalinema sp. RL_2_19]|nr:hypothetical protein [Alkalinema sp. RL_2_19]
MLIEAMNIQPDDVEQGRIEQRFGVIQRGESKLCIQLTSNLKYFRQQTEH